MNNSTQYGYIVQDPEEVNATILRETDVNGYGRIVCIIDSRYVVALDLSSHAATWQYLEEALAGPANIPEV